MPRRLSPRSEAFIADKERVIERLRAGDHMTAIADDYGVDRMAAIALIRHRWGGIKQFRPDDYWSRVHHTRPTKWTEERIQTDIIDHLEDGMTMEQVGELHGLTRQRICQLTQRVGWKRPLKPKGPATEDCHVCFKPYLVGMYRGHCIEEGHAYSIKPGSGIKELVVDMYLNHPEMTTTEIAEATGIAHQERVYRYLEKSGVKPNRGGSNYQRSSKTIARMVKSHAEGRARRKAHAG